MSVALLGGEGRKRGSARREELLARAAKGDLAKRRWGGGRCSSDEGKSRKLWSGRKDSG